MVYTTDDLSHGCGGRLFVDSEAPAQRLLVRLAVGRWLLPMLLPALFTITSLIMGRSLSWGNTLPGLTRQKKAQPGQAFFISDNHKP
jgi:hypothetical protein